MLGLSTGLTYSSYIDKYVVAEYCSDFTQDADGWIKGAPADHNGTPTITGNNNPYSDVGGSAPNSDGWLKVVYGANQSILQGGNIRRELAPSPFSFHGSISNPGPPYIGDLIDVEFDIYIYHNGVDDHWDGTDNIQVRIEGSWLNPTSSDVFSLNTTSIMNVPGSVGLQYGGGRNVEIGFGPGDRPRTGATFYMKNYCATVYRR
tara:strand:- start:434 stop:1045 length:612 start_codon:yes stop_codon:yes gene_type:complete